jgi:hypothetical protein
MLGHLKRCPEGLSVKLHTHHHMEQARSLSGRAQTCRRQAKAGKMDCKQEETGQPI